MTPEEKKVYMKEYRQKNKAKLYEQKKEYDKKKKTDEVYQTKIREYKRVWANEHYDADKSAEYYKENTDVCKERIKNWRGNTYNGQKYVAVNNWKRYGVIHEDFDKLYALYIATTECNVCHKVFKKSSDRCLDHNHTTGEYRQILCQSCNNHDHWKNKI